MAGRVYRGARVMSLRDWAKAIALALLLAPVVLIGIAWIVLG